MHLVSQLGIMILTVIAAYNGIISALRPTGQSST